MFCRKVIILLEVSVLRPASEVAGKIGDPKAINAESKMDQQQQQPLHNANGHAQHSTSGMALL